MYFDVFLKMPPFQRLFAESCRQRKADQEIIINDETITVELKGKQVTVFLGYEAYRTTEEQKQPHLTNDINGVSHYSASIVQKSYLTQPGSCPIQYQDTF